jgi:ABC-type multidrug transport system ATPase subunit
VVVYSIEALTKRYKGQSRPANSEISLDIPEGRIVGIFGPNGAGKTTLVRQMTSLLAPTSGHISLYGHDIIKRPNLTPRFVSYYGQKTAMLRNYTATEVLVYSGVFRGLSPGVAREQAALLLERFALAHIAEKRLARLSGGQQRLPVLLAAFMGDPKVVVLDESTNELDPINRSKFWTFLEEMRTDKGLTAIITSHNLAEAERVVEMVVFIADGRLVAVGTPGELKRQVSNAVRLEVKLKELFYQAAEEKLAALPLGRKIKSGHWEFITPHDNVEALTNTLLRQIGLEVLDDFRLVTPSMDDVYIQLVETSSTNEGEMHAN